jgi:Ca-activated chloride channel family protein
MRFVLASALVALCASPSAQQTSVTVKLVSPTPDSYVSGTVLLRASIEPRQRVRSVSRVQFYADGRLVCNVMDPARAQCTWDAGDEIREHVIRVVAELVGGGRVVTSGRTKALDLAERVSVDIVQITAVVSDGGRFINGLPQSAFVVHEDGVGQTIAHFSAEGSPLEIVVAIDVSASMTNAMPQLRNAVKRFLSALGPKDQVTLAAFNDNLFTLTQRETSAEQRLRAVDRLAPWGGTALYDVIVRGLHQLSRLPGRRVLVVFTDGDDRTSHATIDSVEQAVRASDATLFMVGLDRGARNANLKSGIERLVDLSGGRALFVERSDRLDEPFAEIIEELANQYLIGFESTNQKRDGTWRELTIDVPGKGYSIRARQGYRAPSS